MSWDKTGRRSWEINTDGKVWPCCKFINKIYSNNGIKKLNDEKLEKLIQEDPNWNNIFVNSIDDIMSHWAYSEYIHPIGWNSDSPPDLCARLCGRKKKKEEDTNYAGHIQRFNKE